MYLLGWDIGCLIVPRLGDLYGRKIPYAVSMGASLVVHLGLILSHNIYLTMALFFLLGLTCPGKSNIAYVYLLELVPTKMQTSVGTVLLLADGSTMIFLSLYFRFISRDWLPFQIFALSFAALGFLVTLLAPESPKYLYSYKKYKESRKALEIISKFNRVKMEVKEKYIFDTEYKEMKQSRTTIPILPSNWKSNNLEYLDN
jgi:MFS family permease